MVDPNGPLSREEFESLRQITSGPLKPVMPPEHRAKLLELGLIKEGPSELEITNYGKLRLEKGE